MAEKETVKTTSYTVKAGRNSRTFATKKEAKEYAAECKKPKSAPPPIVESKKTPTHKVVKFIAKT